MHLVLIDKGYAIIHRFYKTSKLILEERYYGVEHEPVLSTSGYGC